MVCKWLGNTSNVAHKHDRTVTEDDYAKAIGNGGLSGEKCEVQPPEIARNNSHEKRHNAFEMWEIVALAEVVNVLENSRAISITQVTSRQGVKLKTGS